MNKLQPLHVGAALALTAALLNVLCALLVLLFPDGSIDFVNAWSHGLDLRSIKSVRPATWESFGYGLIGVALVAFVVGTVFAGCYNLLARFWRQA